MKLFNVCTLRLLNDVVLTYATAQQHLLQAQTTSLEHFKVLPSTNHSQNLQFITRDAAAEESKGLIDRVKKLEATVREKNSRISEFEGKGK